MGFIGAEGETRQGFALSLLSQNPICMSVLLCLSAYRRTWTNRVRVSRTKKIIPHTKRCMELFGAEGETRTLAPVSRPTPLAGAPRHQLEYFCKCNGFNHYLIKKRAVTNYNPHLAERVGFEPTVRCRTTVFKTVPL